MAEHRRPPPHVLHDWSLSAAVPLAAGQGEAFVGDGLVLKPVEDETAASWLAEAVGALGPDPDDVRVARPVRARSGAWVVGGWSAWRWLDGEHREGSWEAVLDVADRFHAFVAELPPPPEATHAWGVADRFAWEELPLVVPPAASEVISTVRGALRPVALPRQLIHGDLLGNVLFHGELPPAVIDISPYWRPAAYARAIVAADAVAWGGAPDGLVTSLGGDDSRQLVLRAVLFRIVAAARRLPPSDGRLEQEVTRYGRVAEIVLGERG